MSNKEFMKVYHMPFKVQEIKDDNFTNFTLQCEQAFEQMTKSFSEQQDEIIINYLYGKYKDTKVSDVWVLSKPDFEKFLLEMLPKWKEPKQYVDELKLVEKSLKALEIIKEKNVNMFGFKRDIKQLGNRFTYKYYQSNLGNNHSGFDIQELTEEEFELLRSVLE